MPTLGAVSHITATELMSLHDALKAAALGNTDRIHEVALGENIGSNNVAGLYGQREVTELLEPLDRLRVMFPQMPQSRLGKARFLLRIKTQLYGAVTILFRRAHLHNLIRTSEDNRHADGVAPRVIDGGLADFLSEQTDHKTRF